MNFKEHKNLEEITINDFINSQELISLEELKNQSFATYDFSFSSGATNNYFPIMGAAEAKTRKYSSTKYDGGVLLEVKKLSAVLTQVGINKKKNINENWKGFYLVKYTDRTFFFDLEQVNLKKIEMKLCPVSSSTDGSNEWIYKACVMLDPKEALIRI